MTINKHAVRVWALESGQPVGKRGRISAQTVVAYLRAHPSEARAFAREMGLEVGERGRLSSSLFATVAAGVK